MQRTLLLKVTAAAVLGIAAGWAFPHYVGFYNLLGQLFLRALTLIVIPLVGASLVAGVMRLGTDNALKRIGSKVAITFIATMATAVALGVAAVALFDPGDSLSLQAQLSTHSLGLNAPIATDFWSNAEQLLYRLVPVNILAAASNGEILGVIAFALFFGIMASHIPEEQRGTLKNFWEATFQTLLRMTTGVMRFLPWGVFGLLAKAAATLGATALASLGWFSLSVAVAFVIFALFLLPLALFFFANVSPIRHFRAMLPALITAFSTSSSAASLPITLECLEKGAGVSNRICSIVVPLGSSVNLCASALYAAAVVTFVAQLDGVHMSTAMLLTIYAITLLTSFGMAGVPSASLIVVVLVLQMLQISSDHIAIVMAIERIVDMIRTAINVFATSCCAVIVARWEGESTALRLRTHAA